eukprot:365650-Chlamydomonas_euryale.AAC.11
MARDLSPDRMFGCIYAWPMGHAPPAGVMGHAPPAGTAPTLKFGKQTWQTCAAHVRAPGADTELKHQSMTPSPCLHNRHLGEPS